MLYKFFLICLIVTGIGMIVRLRLSGARSLAVYATLAAALIGSTLYAVMRPGNLFTHYFQLFLVPCTLVAGFSASWIARSATKSPTSWLVSGACLVGVISYAFASRDEPPWPHIETSNFAVVAPDSVFESGDLLSWLPGTNSGGMVVWGWEPVWYVWSGLRPSTRDTNAYNQLTVGPLLDYFRSRFLHDFDMSPPAVVVDAPSPGSFTYVSYAEFGAHVFPELQQRLDREHVLVSSTTDLESCPRVYFRSDVARYVLRQFARVQDIRASASYSVGGMTFSPNAVDDWRIFEIGGCLDRWLLPDGTLGSIGLDLTQSEVIDAVRILNTRNGNGPVNDRTTLEVKVQVLDRGEVVFETATQLKRYPNWTVTRVPDVRGDEVRIEVTRFEGVGGGLNEVKVSKRSPLAAD
jgi:hypothetical protein